MSEILKVSRCMYCEEPCKVIKDGEKYFTDCPKCGKRELTKLGLARMNVRNPNDKR